MEVFVAIKPDEDLDLVGRTLEAWEAMQGCDPINVVQCKSSSFETDRRITADRIAKQDWYVLADVGVVPASRVELAGAAKRLNDSDGLVGLRPESECDDYPLDIRPRPTTPHGIVLVRRGVLEGWPEQMSSTYNDEHAEAVRQAGKRVLVWQDTFFKRLPAHS